MTKLPKDIKKRKKKVKHTINWQKNEDGSNTVLGDDGVIYKIWLI